MRTILYPTVIALLASTMLCAQPTNGGFETWVAGNPVDWVTSNVLPVFANVTQTSDAHGGASAVRGECLLFPQGNLPFPPLIMQNGPTGFGLPVSQNYAQLEGWYKYNSTQGSTFVSITAIASDANQQAVGAGGININTTASSYTSFSFPINYSFGSNGPAATISVIIAMGDTTTDPGLGSWIIVDDLQFSGVAQSVSETQQQGLGFSIGALYPQPFMDQLSAEIHVSEAEQITMLVYNALGSKVHQSEPVYFTPGMHTLSWEPEQELPNGMYILEVSSNSGTLTKKILRGR